MKRTRFPGALSLAAAILVAGCGGHHPQADGGLHRPPHRDQWVLGFSQAGTADPWRQAMSNEMMHQFQFHTDVLRELTLRNASGSSTQQVQNVQDLEARPVNLLIVDPINLTALAPVTQKLLKAHIPVIALEQPLPDESCTCSITPDNGAVGRMAGEFLAQALNGKGNVIEVEGTAQSLRDQEIHRGFVAALAKAPGIHLGAVVTGGDTAKTARAAAARFLSGGQQVAGIYAHDDLLAQGVSQAAAAAHLQRQVKIVGTGGTPGPQGGAAAVKAGKLTATIYYPTGAKEAIDTSLQILAGKNVPRRITPAPAVVTPGNAAQYISEF